MTLLRAIHDDSMSDALDELVDGRSVVGVMGGHATPRGTPPYAAAASLGQALARAGFLVATGGGPGAMEAANLGAFCRDRSVLDEALGRLAAVPSFTADVTAWAGLALQVRADVAPPAGAAPTSLGVPTWFYGHEPPGVFVDGLAKFFSNAVREDGLLARCSAGVIVLPGAAGTVQEVFQAATRLYYAEAPPPPLVLVGRQHWTEVVPVWETLSALGADRTHVARRTPRGRAAGGAGTAQPVTCRGDGDRPVGSGGGGGQLPAGAVDLAARGCRGPSSGCRGRAAARRTAARPPCARRSTSSPASG